MTNKLSNDICTCHFNKIKRSSLPCKILIFTYFSAVIFFIGKFFREIYKGFEYTSYQVTEMLINYRSGFVRRGLTGDITWWLSHSFGISPYYISCFFCAISFVIVNLFFVYMSIKRKISLVYLPLVYICIILILRRDWFRKDCLMMIVFILCAYCLKLLFDKKLKYGTTLICLNILCAFMFLVHEAFVFFSVPLFALFIFKFLKDNYVSYLKPLLLTIVAFIPCLIVLLIVVLCKGTEANALQIWESYGGYSFFGSEAPTGAIDAIGWTTDYAINLHYTTNFVGDYIDHDVAVMNKNLLWIICIIVAYFMTFRWNKIQIISSGQASNMNHSTSMGVLLLFQFITLLPMFTILSCDYARLLYYMYASSFTIVLLFPKNTILSLFPQSGVKAVKRIV